MDERGYSVAIVGATGAVGQAMIQTLERYPFPVKELKLLASARSAGKIMRFRNTDLVVETLTTQSFEGVEIALFSAGGSISKQFVPHAVKSGALVVDNTSVFRMDEDKPLVVPEVNIEDIQVMDKIIANPNCSTIQLVVALAPLQVEYGILRVDVSTYQAASGAGAQAIEELQREQLDPEYVPCVLPVRHASKHFRLAGNVIPQIDVFTESGYTFEELKMINETRKILHHETLEMSATCVRVPVVYGHCVSATIKLKTAIENKEALFDLYDETDYVCLVDDCQTQTYPMPLDVLAVDEVLVGRIRVDMFDPHIVHVFIVANNILKGAALNSVQIIQKLHELGRIEVK